MIEIDQKWKRRETLDIDAVSTYIFVDHKGAFKRFTTDHDRGMRFARRMDAERLRMLLLGMEFPSARRYAAVEWVT